MDYNELELMINNNCTYEEIIEESKRLDEYIKQKINKKSIALPNCG